MAKKKTFLIRNVWQTPDKTILESRHVHDFNSYMDDNGKCYSIDGGLDYQRIVGDIADLKDLSTYSDAPFEIIRENLFRGTHGKNFDEPYKRVLLKDINDEWLDNIIIYEETYRPDNKFLQFYYAEREYRKQ